MRRSLVTGLCILVSGCAVFDDCDDGVIYLPPTPAGYGVPAAYSAPSPYQSPQGSSCGCGSVPQRAPQPFAPSTSMPPPINTPPVQNTWMPSVAPVPPATTREPDLR